MKFIKEIPVSTLTEADQSVLHCLAYFDIFNYPLLLKEVFTNSGYIFENEKAVLNSCDKLVDMGLIVKEDKYYFLSGRKSPIQRRLKGNQLAQKRLKTARRYSRLISGFPFVRAVMLSGSLSKNFMEPDGDIDYFIITEPGRLWISRTLLILFKKIFLLNSHKNFCVNYFIDTEHLEIEDKNLFTSTEIRYLLPTVNYSVYSEFMKANKWIHEFLPNSSLREVEFCTEERKGLFKRIGEKALMGKWGEKMDQKLMKRTLGHWKKKFDHFDEEAFEVALRSRKYVSKHHPSHYQNIVKGKMENTLNQIAAKSGIETGKAKFVHDERG